MTPDGTTVGGVDDSSILEFSADGFRGTLTTSTFDEATQTSTTSVAVFNVDTVHQVGSTLTVAGYAKGGALFNANGSAAAVTTTSFDAGTGTSTTRLALINTATGNQVGSTLTVTGDADTGALFNADGSAAAVTTTSLDPDTGTAITRLALINTATGNQIGDTLTLAGDVTSGNTAVPHAIFNPDSEHAAIAVTNGTETPRIIRVTVLEIPNTAPVATAVPTVGSPNGDGVITGKLNVTDADGDALSYQVVTGPSKGVVTIDNVTGTYTYAPTNQARLQASLTTGTVETDTFTIGVTDRRSAPVSVTVRDVLVAELPVNSVVATPAVGDSPRAVALSPDGSRAYRREHRRRHRHRSQHRRQLHGQDHHGGRPADRDRAQLRPGAPCMWPTPAAAR